MPRSDAGQTNYGPTASNCAARRELEVDEKLANHMLSANWQYLHMPLDVATSLKEAIWKATLENRDTEAQQSERDETHAERWLRNTMSTARTFCEAAVASSYKSASETVRDTLTLKLDRDHATIEQWAETKATQLETDLAWEAARTEHLRKHCFPIITAAAADWIKEKAGRGPVLEVGAGNGYLAKELNTRGMNVHPTDPQPPNGNPALTWRLPVDGIHVEPISGLKAVRKYTGSNLLWSWPNNYDEGGEDCQAKIIEAFRGDTLIYIGEPEEGCTGTPAFHKALGDKFTPEDEYRIPTFPNMHDRIEAYRRKI